jgi:uncharacterized membrane protein
MNFVDGITRAERLSRIGELLAKGVALMLAREAQEKEDLKQVELLKQNSASTRTTHHAEHAVGENDAESAMLAYLLRVGAASPRDIQLAMDMSKATAFRRLDHLVKNGLVTRAGKTTAIRYRVIKSTTKLVK